ncbi:MAG: 50S ribosomal protein L24 [Candidatus Poribacteria bacterium]|nr:50S ribosomal protein L24 [Candidatus Poribacteria bacterium]
MPKRKRMKFRVKVGDLVKVVSGDWIDVQGTVTEVDRVRGRVVVDGVNLKTKHMRPNQRFPEGGIVEREASIHISNVRVIEEAADS